MPLTTKSMKGDPDPEPTKADLAADASALEVEGRSSMSKDELAEALAPEPAKTLGQTLDEIAGLWQFVGHDSVNDQPVKVPSEEELDRLADLLPKAAELVKMAQEKA